MNLGTSGKERDWKSLPYCMYLFFFYDYVYAPLFFTLSRDKKKNRGRIMSSRLKIRMSFENIL